MRVLRILLLIALLGPLTLVARGQSRSDSDAIRVRVFRTDHVSPVVGTLVPPSAGADAFHVIDKAGVRHRFNMTQPLSVQRSQGRAHLKWALAGAAAGVIGGAILGYALGPEYEETGHWFVDPWAEPTMQMENMIVGAGIGLVAGALIGAVSAPERWVTISSMDAVSVYVTEQGSLLVRLNR